MAQPIMGPIAPQAGSLKEAIAASSEIIFTATDRKIIEERTGEVERGRRFKEIFKDGITPEVENEQTTVEEGRNVPELRDRLKISNQMQRSAPFSAPKEKVEITGGKNLSAQIEQAASAATVQPTAEITVEPPPAPVEEPVKPTVSHETAKLIKELNLDPVELSGIFALSEEELHKLILKIKGLHLKRVLAGSKADFENLSKKIKEETLSFAKKESRKWLEEKLDELTTSTIQYKLHFAQAMQSLDFSAEREKDIGWLESFSAV